MRAAFERNFAEHGEVGAGTALYGRKVVDLWGGWADTEATTPYGEDTLQLVNSLGFSYVTNRMHAGLTGDPRSVDLIRAAYEAIGAEAPNLGTPFA